MKAVLVPVATAFAQPTLEFWSLNVYTAWYLWLLALGVLLVLRPVEPALADSEDRPTRVGA